MKYIELIEGMKNIKFYSGIYKDYTTLEEECKQKMSMRSK